LIVTLVLVGVGDGELGYGLLEDIRAAIAGSSTGPDLVYA
jgi:hypothetical protein